MRLVGNCCAMNAPASPNDWAFKIADELIHAGALRSYGRNVVVETLVLAGDKGRSEGRDQAIAAIRGQAA